MEFRTERERKAAQRREDLINAALSAFSAKGFAGSTIKDVAAEAGVTDGLIYHYFSSKEDLLWAVLEKHHFMGEVTHILHFDTDRPIEQVLTHLAEKLLQLMHSKASFVVMFFGEAQRNPVVSDRLQKLVNSGVRLLSGFLQQRIASGELKEANMSYLARHFLGSIFIYFFTYERFQPEEKIAAERPDYLREVVTALCEGMLRQG